MVRRKRQKARAGSALARIALALVTTVATVGVSGPSAAQTAPTEAQVRLVRSYLNQQAHPEARAELLSQISAAMTPDAVRNALDRARTFTALPAGVHHRSVQTDAGDVPYLMVIPAGYSPERPWPVHFSLHGGGARGRYTNCLTQWERPPDKDFVLVCPSAPGGRWWKPTARATLMHVFESVLDEVHVDTDRVSIGGVSNGGTGTWHVAVEQPWLWAAAVVRCGASLGLKAPLHNMAALPAFVVHGDRDRAIKVGNSRVMVAHLRKLGANPVYHEVRGVGHRFFSSFNEEVTQWRAAQLRRLPAHFEYTALDGMPTGLIYWLVIGGEASTLRASITGGDGPARVEVHTDVEPGHLRIFLPDTLLGIRDSVQVWVNGTERFRGPVIHSAKDVLDSYELSHDPRRSFTASVTID